MVRVSVLSVEMNSALHPCEPENMHELIHGDKWRTTGLCTKGRRKIEEETKKELLCFEKLKTKEGKIEKTEKKMEVKIFVCSKSPSSLT